MNNNNVKKELINNEQKNIKINIQNYITIL